MANILRFTDEEVRRADSVDILSYASSAGYRVKKVSAKSYKIEGYGGLYIDLSGQKWNWFSQGKGGGPVQFVMEMEGKTWVEAVKQLLGIDRTKISITSPAASDDIQEKGEFILPEKNKTFKHIFAYLIQTRCIDKDIVYHFVKEGKIFENIHKSCVFVGYDNAGNARYANIRSTNTTGKSFRCDVKNSDKAYPFSFTGTGDTVYVFESPIDLLSYLSLLKLHKVQGFDYHCISLGGVADKALEYYLGQHPEIQNIMLCLDNDEAGHFSCEQIHNRFKDGYKIQRHLPKGKDFNEDLVLLSKQLGRSQVSEDTEAYEVGD